MMMDALYRIEDRVVMDMDREARAWGRQGPPNGTLGTVTGRAACKRDYGFENGRHAPGRYTFDGALIVLWDDGSETVGETIKLVDQEEAERRRNEHFNVRSSTERDEFVAMVLNEQKYAALPETPFVAGDIVRDLNPLSRDEEGIYFKVRSIDYDFSFSDGTVDHVYQIDAYDFQHRSRFGTSRVGNMLELIEHGNLWREMNGQPLVFRDLAEESTYANARGRSQSVINPRTDNYAWTLDEILDAAERGEVDGFLLAQIPFSSQRHHDVRRFDDRDLGDRVRAAMLVGFGRKEPVE